MRLIIALAAVGSLAACSHNNNNPQPGPETGQVSTDTVQTTRTPAGTIDTSRAGGDTVSRKGPAIDTAAVGEEPRPGRHEADTMTTPYTPPPPDTSSMRHDSM